MGGCLPISMICGGGSRDAAEEHRKHVKEALVHMLHHHNWSEVHTTAVKCFRTVDARNGRRPDGKLEWDNGEIKDFVKLLCNERDLDVPSWDNEVLKRLYVAADKDKSNGLDLEESIEFAKKLFSDLLSDMQKQFKPDDIVTFLGDSNATSPYPDLEVGQHPGKVLEVCEGVDGDMNVVPKVKVEFVVRRDLKGDPVKKWFKLDPDCVSNAKSTCMKYDKAYLASATTFDVSVVRGADRDTGFTFFDDPGRMLCIAKMTRGRDLHPMMVGDVIVQVNKTPVRTAQEYYAQAKQLEVFDLTVQKSVKRVLEDTYKASTEAVEQSQLCEAEIAKAQMSRRMSDVTQGADDAGAIAVTQYLKERRLSDSLTAFERETQAGSAAPSRLSCCKKRR